MSKTSPALRLRDALPPCLALRAARAAFTLAPTVLLSWGWLSDTPLTRIDRRPNACHEPCPTQNENVQARHSAPAALASPRAPRFRLLRTHRKRKKKATLYPCSLALSARARVLCASHRRRAQPTNSSGDDAVGRVESGHVPMFTLGRPAHARFLHPLRSFHLRTLSCSNTHLPGKKKQVLRPSVCCVVLGHGSHLPALARRTHRGYEPLSSIPCALTRVLSGPSATNSARTCFLIRTHCVSHFLLSGCHERRSIPRG